MSSYLDHVCTFCKSKKKQCDGKSPCSNCVRANKSCLYHAETDRRRRKYHTDYIDHLVAKSEKLEGFIKTMLKDDPAALKKFDDNLRYLDLRNEEKVWNSLVEENRFKALLHSAKSLNINDFSDVDHPEERVLANLQNDATLPIGVNGLNLYFIDPSFKEKLIDCFEENCPDLIYVMSLSIPEIRTWKFSSDVPSHQLLMCSLFSIACIHYRHPMIREVQRLLITEAEEIAISACRFKLDKFLIQGLLLLSCYEMGMGNDSVSYLFASVACSLTQHMGFHISYDQNSSAAKFAPKTTPYQSALLWSVCTQDRLITTLLGVPSCIHYKRIISPFYSPQLSPSHKNYITELSFSYSSRLWYILDRFLDQICSTQGDFGDTQERTKLLKAGQKALTDLRNSLPPQLTYSTDQRNKNALLVHLNYCVCVILLQRLLIQELPLIASNACIQAAIEASTICRILLDTDAVKSTSYQFGYLVYTIAMIFLVYLVEKKDHTSKFYGYFLTCVRCLEINGLMWARSVKSLRSLINFAEVNNYFSQELFDAVVSFSSDYASHDLSQLNRATSEEPRQINKLSHIKESPTFEYPVDISNILNPSTFYNHIPSQYSPLPNNLRQQNHFQGMQQATGYSLNNMANSSSHSSTGTHSSPDVPPLSQEFASTPFDSNATTGSSTTTGFGRLDGDTGNPFLFR